MVPTASLEPLHGGTMKPALLLLLLPLLASCSPAASDASPTNPPVCKLSGPLAIDGTGVPIADVDPAVPWEIVACVFTDDSGNKVTFWSAGKTAWPGLPGAYFRPVDYQPFQIYKGELVVP